MRTVKKMFSISKLKDILIKICIAEGFFSIFFGRKTELMSYLIFVSLFLSILRAIDDNCIDIEIKRKWDVRKKNNNISFKENLFGFFAIFLSFLQEL